VSPGLIRLATKPPRITKRKINGQKSPPDKQNAWR
jgi:hypothetical protein